MRKILLINKLKKINAAIKLILFPCINKERQVIRLAF
jgi:hypothetical protein